MSLKGQHGLLDQAQYIQTIQSNPFHRKKIADNNRAKHFAQDYCVKFPIT